MLPPQCGDGGVYERECNLCRPGCRRPQYHGSAFDKRSGETIIVKCLQRDNDIAIVAAKPAVFSAGKDRAQLPCRLRELGTHDRTDARCARFRLGAKLIFLGAIATLLPLIASDALAEQTYSFPSGTSLCQSYLET